MAALRKAGTQTIDATAAVEAANRLTDATARETRPENDPAKFINVRLRETDWKRIGKMAIDAGITKAAFCKFAALYIADMVDQGACKVGGGGIIDRRG